MKKVSKLFAILLSIGLLSLTNCKNKDNSGEDNSGLLPPPVEDNVKEEDIYLGLFETKSYVPNTKNSFEVNIEDDTIVKYEDGSFITNIKEGTTKARFASSAIEYVVTVNVKKDETVPKFELENQQVSIFNNSNYVINTSLTYRGVNVFGYSTGLHITKETSGDANEAVVEDSVIRLSGTNVGTETYTIYTEFAGFVLSKTLTVKTINNNGLVICGHNLAYNELGPQYKISMFRYNEHRILLRDDISVLKAGAPVNFDSLIISPRNTSILDIEDGYLAPKKVGKTYIDVSYGGESIAITVNVFKPVTGQRKVISDDMDFDLDMSITVSSNTRIYTPGNTSKALVIPEGEEYLGVLELSANGNELEFDNTQVTYNVSSRVVTLSASLFNVHNYGKQPVVVTMETSESLYEYTFTVNFITKFLTKYDDLKTCFYHSFVKDTMYGQYILANDIDCEGKDATASYVALGELNYNYYTYGFRGILDGNGYAIKNYRTTMYGFFLIIGNDALIKNLSFTDVHYRSIPSGSTLGTLSIGRFISGATFSNVTLTLASDSVSDVATGTLTDFGVVATQVFSYCVVNDFIINAQGFDLIRVFGNNVNGTVFSNTKIYCRSIDRIGYTYQSIDGVEVILDQ